MEQSIENIVGQIKQDCGVELRKLLGKQIIYQGCTHARKTIVVAFPRSAVHVRGHGWVDLTQVQRDVLSMADHAAIVFRLDNGRSYLVDFNEIKPLLNDVNSNESKQVGVHWKLDIWPGRVVMKKGGASLLVSSDFVQWFSALS